MERWHLFFFVCARESRMTLAKKGFFFFFARQDATDTQSELRSRHHFFLT